MKKKLIVLLVDYLFEKNIFPAVCHAAIGRDGR